MKRKFGRNHSRRVVLPFFVILMILFTAAVLAQTSGAGQTTGRSNTVLPPARAAAVAQTFTSSTDTAGRSAVGPSHTKRHCAVPLDENPPLFLPAVAYDTGSAVTVAVADVNGDGKPDLVVATSGSVEVLLGNGDGTFQAALDVGGSSGYLAVRDVNGDGIPDLVVTGCTGSNCAGYVAVLLGNGDGTFQTAVTYDSGGDYPLAVAAGDVNGDGKPDLVVTNCVSHGQSCGYYPGLVGVLLGNGDGTFQPVVTYDSGGDYPAAVAIADLNGDAKPDLVVGELGSAGWTSGVAAVLLGNGNGTFQPPATYDVEGVTPSSVAIADVNRDHKLDLVVTSQCSEPSCHADGVVSVLLGNGDGTFQLEATYDSGGFEPRSVAVQDVNGDGKPDVAVANTGTDRGSAGVLLGNGDGTFQAAVTFDSGGISALGVALADVNGDGLPDLLLANQCTTTYCGPGTIGVLLNDTGPHSPTTTTLASSLNPSLFGQEVTFTAQVSSASGTPTGTVIFSDGSTQLGSATLVNGSASLSTSLLTAGLHAITAAYQVSLKFDASTSSPFSQVVNMAATTTSLVSSPNPARVNQLITYTATVSGQYGAALTGTVTFQDAGATFATATLLGNQAACTTTYAAPGNHAITATYSGDANNFGSASSVLVEQINKAFASKTVVATSGSPSFVGQPVTFSATVRSAHGAIPNGELVTFYDGNTAIGTGTTASGVATFTTSALAARTHTIKATYVGDATFDPSTGSVKQQVEKYATATALSSTLNPSQYGQAVTFTAQVTSSGPVPTGAVKFMDGTKSLGSRKLTGGIATLTVSRLGVGTHPITAQYLGDGASIKSTSPVLDQVVQ